MGMGLELAYDYLGVLEYRLFASCCVASHVVFNEESFGVFVRAVYCCNDMFTLKVRRLQTITILLRCCALHRSIDTELTNFFGIE